MEQLYDSAVMTITIAVSSLIQLLYQSSTQYLLVAEAIVAIGLLCSNLTSVNLSSIRAYRITLMYLTAMLCVVITFASIRHVYGPMQPTMSDHPIEELIRTSRARFFETLAKQSRTLDEAVHEYNARTGMHPPPKFDQWYAYAKSNDVQMIDEYDIIQDLLRPFWGVPPATIRHYVRDALSSEDNEFMGIFIRNGQVSKVINTGNCDSYENGNVKILQNFVHHLPDMDLLFNCHDEPSVIIPRDMLDRLVATARKNHRHKKPYNFFSERPSDVVDDIGYHYGTNVFNPVGKMVWNTIIQSCPLDSPVREIGGTDLSTSYARFPLGFIYNTTAFSNVCNQPSLPYHHGFFDRPACSRLFFDVAASFFACPK